MVFYYTIRGGRCLNEHSHIELSSEDIICYVGRDKHENEYLIQYGWPGDIWFHVDGLSSAHVYFRLKNPDEVSSIPIDNLPPDSVYDMMQICKNNSIAGCKLASCKENIRHGEWGCNIPQHQVVQVSAMRQRSSTCQRAGKNEDCRYDGGLLSGDERQRTADH